MHMVADQHRIQMLMLDQTSGGIIIIFSSSFSVFRKRDVQRLKGGEGVTHLCVFLHLYVCMYDHDV